ADRAVSALQCLQAGGGDSAGKSRLLVALCRNRDIPARLVSGLVLAGDQEQSLHYWVEAWIDEHWYPMCPKFHHFGQRRFPRNYLVLNFGDDDLFRGPRQLPRYVFVVQANPRDSGIIDDAPFSSLRSFWLRASLYGLQPAEQRLVRILLLLPLGALIVSIFRTVIGVPTFGT